jgi:uncharacterized damage-inducible protein DinB
MPPVMHSFLSLPADFRSPEVALHFAELEDQTVRLFEHLSDLTPDALAWQPAPGRNTIGMLLAHLAVVEVFWIDIGVRGLTDTECASVLGLDFATGDGMPCPPDGAPPAHLNGRDLDGYRALLARARAHVASHLRGLDDAALTVARTRTRRDGNRQDYDVRWVLYHVVEHFAGHFGQALLLRELQREALRATAR